MGLNAHLDLEARLAQPTSISYPAKATWLELPIFSYCSWLPIVTDLNASFVLQSRARVDTMRLIKAYSEEGEVANSKAAVLVKVPTAMANHNSINQTCFRPVSSFPPNNNNRAALSAPAEGRGAEERAGELCVCGENNTWQDDTGWENTITCSKLNNTVVLTPDVRWSPLPWLTSMCTNVFLEPFSVGLFPDAVCKASR